MAEDHRRVDLGPWCAFADIAAPAVAACKADQVGIADVFEHHSLVIATDYRVPDPSRIGPVLQSRRDALADLGAHHVLVYRSTQDAGRVLVLIGVHSREPVTDLLRSRVFFDWFDDVGVDDIPAVFAGEIVERVDLTDPAEQTAPAGVMVAVIATVEDIASAVSELRHGQGRFAAAGTRRVWVFHAFDEDREVLVLQEFENEGSARRWMEHPDSAAVWMSHAGVGVYPPLFVGEFDSLVRVDGA